MIPFEQLLDRLQGKASVTDLKETVTIEKGNYVTKITVTFNKEGIPLWVDVVPEHKVSPKEEQINHLQGKLKEYIAKGEWGVVAEIADQLHELEAK